MPTEDRRGEWYYVSFRPDEQFFKNFRFVPDFLEDKMWNYAYLNAGLTIKYNGNRYHSKDGLLDLLASKTDEESIRYPIIHLKSDASHRKDRRLR